MYSMNDKIEYIADDGVIGKGIVIKRVGLFKNKYIVRCSFVFRAFRQERAILVNERDIIGFLKEDVK